MNYIQNNFISDIDILLSNHNYDKLNSLFTDELMQSADYDELAYLCLFILIYRQEKANNVNAPSLSLGTNTEELISVFRKIKFLLWEFEFDNNEESTQQLINFITANNISVEFLRTVIMTSSVNKEKVLIGLSNIFS